MTRFRLTGLARSDIVNILLRSESDSGARLAIVTARY